MAGRPAKTKSATPNMRRQTAGTSESGSKIRTKSTQSLESRGFVHSQTKGKAVYELIQGTENTIQIIKSSHVIGVDDEGQSRFMRYCTNQPTIWEDEQNEPFVRSRIEIQGELVVNGDTRQGRLLQDFLDRHPSNGVIYRKIDPVKDASDAVAAEELILDMKLKIRELSSSPEGEERLRDVGNAIGYKSAAANEDINILKNKLFELASDYNGAIKFRDALNDRFSRALSLVEKSYANGAISYTNNIVRWAGDENELLRVPTGKSWQSHLAAQLASDITGELWKEFELASRPKK